MRALSALAKAVALALPAADEEEEDEEEAACCVDFERDALGCGARVGTER